MRPVLPGDVIAAARALLPLPPECRATGAERMVTQADAADRYRKRFQRAHALWGNGTLMSVALAHPLSPARHMDDPEFAECQFLVLQALLRRRRLQKPSIG